MATNVVVVGGGNAAHVLSARISSCCPDFRCVLLTRFGTEAEDLHAACAEHGGIVCNNDWTDTAGKPVKGMPTITDNVAEATEKSDIIIFALPATADEGYLRDMAPVLTSGDKQRLLVRLPAQGGFDMAVHHALGGNLANVVLVGLETLPWACRIVEPGAVVNVLSTKVFVDVAVHPPESAEQALATVQTLIGPLPELKAGPCMLSLTLNNINATWHPALTYAAYRNWDGKTPFKEAPLFYESCDDFAATLLTQVSEEIMAIKAAVLHRCPLLDMSATKPALQWIRSAYGSDVGDPSTLKSAIRTNKGYKGLRHKMAETADGLMPDFTYRYTSEDVPCGLVVNKGFALLLGVPTPRIDEEILWFQKMTGHVWLDEDGDLCGRDLDETRTPQRYGFTTFEAVIKALHLTPPCEVA